MIIREVVPHALPQPSYPCFIGVHPWLKILRIPLLLTSVDGTMLTTQSISRKIEVFGHRCQTKALAHE
jgi:hypothetical protein